MYTVDIVVMYFIVLYLFNFNNQSNVLWKYFEECLKIFHLKSHSLNSVR